MLRTVGRTALLLLVSGLVAGALYLLVDREQSPGTTAGSEQGARVLERGSRVSREDGRGAWRHEGNRGEDRARGAAGRGRDGATWDRGDRRGSHGEFSLGRGVTGLVFTAAQVTVIAAVVVGLQRVTRRRKGAPEPA